jgi:hypothetical protein
MTEDKSHPEHLLRECAPGVGGPAAQPPAARVEPLEALSDDDVPMVIATRFLEAFRQSGCPMCFLGQQALDDYFSHWVWDYVSDADLREAMRRGLGMCAEHTWQLLHTDVREYGETFGVSIIYQELVAHTIGLLERVALEAQAREAQRPSRLGRLRRWLYRRSAARRWFLPARWRGSPLLKAAECHVCAYRAESERRSTYWLVQVLRRAENRTRYAASDGLCLPHLRAALELALEIEPGVARFLAASAGQHLEALAADLDGYVAKRAWDRRHEAMTAGEQEAAQRASRFFGGLDGWSAERRRLDSI